ncbi:MAG: RluA family pseudouridine synthase [Treponema sp.]|nr:RluA family pseudouridine synthase [Treponema sp.]
MKKIDILYSNDEIFIINKPSGLAVQGGKGISQSVDTILPKQIGHKIFLVHRLDKDTAGILVVAKNSQSATKWTKLIGSNQVKKKYFALCFGKMSSNSGIIEIPVETKGVKKNALTHYSVIKCIETEIIMNNDLLKIKDNLSTENTTKICLSLIKLQLDTGRMHQIRIHLSKNDCPIIGDDKYGNFKLNKWAKKHLKIKSLQLASVKLTVPINNAMHTFEIENPLFKI